MSTTPGQRRPKDGHPPRSSSATRLPTAPSGQPYSILSSRGSNEGAGSKIQSRIPGNQAIPPGVRNLNMKYARQPPAIPRSTPSNYTRAIPTPNQIGVVPITDGIRGAPPSTSFVPGGSGLGRQGHPKVLRRKPSVIASYMSTQNAKQATDSKPEVDPAVDTLIIPDTSEPDRKQPLSQIPSTTYTTRAGNESTSTVEQPYPLPRTPLSDPSSQVPSLQYMDSPGAISSIATPTTRSSTSPLIATSPPSFGWSRGPSPTMGRNRPELNTSQNSNRQIGTKAEPYSHPFFQQPITKTIQDPNSGRSTPSTTSSLTKSKSRSKLLKSKPVDKAEKSAIATLPEGIARKAVHPPELAHLKDAKPVNGKQEVPPSRPSRDGIPSLPEDQATSPVVYSNLTTSPQRRTSTSNSLESPSKAQVRYFLPDSPSRSQSKTEPPGNQRPAPDTNKKLPAVQPSKSPSRFGFFKRNKAKVAPDDDEKQARKGPIAGTGHEGYKKHTARKRSISLNSAGSSVASANSSSSRPAASTRRSSNGSSGTESEVDEFLSQRLQPIYMRGDGAVSDSQVYSSSTMNAPNGQTPEQRIRVDTTHIPRASVSSSEPPGLSHSRGSSGSDAFSGRNADHPQKKAQPKVNGSPLAQSQSADWESDNSSSLVANDERKQAVKKTGWLGFSKAFSRGKSVKGSGNTSQSQTLSSPASDAEDSSTEYTSTIPARGVAHYALLDSAEQSPSLEEIEHYMHEVQFGEDSTVRLAEPISITSSSVLSSDPDLNGSVTRNSESLQPSSTTSEATLHTLLPSPFDGAETDIPPQDGDASAIEPLGVIQPPSRPYRLPQVGRIPRVISTRDPLQRHDQSFSRPFGVIQPRPQPATLKENHSPVDNNSQSRILPNNPFSSGMTPLERESADFTDFEEHEDEIQYALKQSEPKFLQFENRKDSDASYSSSSAASYFLSSTPAARIPRPCSPLSEDEVWNEYDDLLDGIFSSDSWKHASGKRLEIINGLNQEIKSEARNADSATSRRPTLRSIIKGGLKSPSLPSGSDKVIPSGSTALSQRQSQASSKGRRVTFDDNDLVSVRNSESSLDPDNKASKHSTSSTSDLTGEYHIRQPAKRIVDVQENADLRFGSLMTSKFLSFGRAFFSPLGEEIQAGQGHHRVLIIDGLGKDWSYYIALTYANTMVYNLGPGSVGGNKRATLSNWQHVDNHRHFNFNDFDTHFPFPKGFFSVVVLRFPPIRSDDTLKHITSECRRVLAPGGFLEVAGLDLDLNNMGTITRKAVRDLKIKLKQDNPDLSLNPLSDSMLLLLGSPGFTNLNRCMVGVPAAGVVASRESSPGSIDKNNVTRFITDLSENGDRKLANMVSTCGRWWHQLMYEIHLLPEKNVLESFWNDVAILRECERHATMFKMLICYAQKPIHTKRRTVSL